MTQTSLIITADADSGTVNRAVTNVNSETADSVCHEFGRKLNALTTHELSGVSRVSKTLAHSAKRRTPTLTLSRNNIPVSELIAARAEEDCGIYIEFSYDGDGEVYVPENFPLKCHGVHTHEYVYTDTGERYIYFFPTVRNGKIFCTCLPDVTLAYLSKKPPEETRMQWRPLPQYTFSIRATETDTCNPVEVTLTFLEE